VISLLLRWLSQPFNSTSSEVRGKGKHRVPADSAAAQTDAGQTRRQRVEQLTWPAQRESCLRAWSLEAGMTPADYAYNCHLLASDLPMLVGPRNVENVP
jgi:hypothetical protein